MSGLVLFVIGLLIKQNRGRRWVLLLRFFLYARHMLWRLLYMIPTDEPASLVTGSITYPAELYGLCQFCFFTYQSWSPTERLPALLTRYPTVDIMVTVVDEPLSILGQTLIGCLSQDYPADRFKVYMHDDGHRPDSRKLAAALGCEYIARPDRPRHANAGNVRRLSDAAQTVGDGMHPGAPPRQPADQARIDPGSTDRLLRLDFLLLLRLPAADLPRRAVVQFDQHGPERGRTQTMIRRTVFIVAVCALSLLPVSSRACDVFTGFQIDNHSQYFGYLGIKTP